MSVAVAGETGLGGECGIFSPPFVQPFLFYALLDSLGGYYIHQKGRRRAQKTFLFNPVGISYIMGWVPSSLPPSLPGIHESQKEGGAFFPFWEYMT